MIDAAKTILNEAPEAFDCVRMNLANNVDFRAVIDAVMTVLVSVPSKIVIYAIVVGEHRALRKNSFLDDRHNRVLLGIQRGVGANSALAFDYSNYRCLGIGIEGSRASRMAALPSANVGLVNLDRLPALTAERGCVLIIQHRANLFEHAPRGFVGDASLPLNLLCRNSAARRSHQVDRVEPNCQGRGRLVEDCVGGRVNVMTAMIARVRRTAHYAMMLGNRLAGIAEDTVRVEVVFQPLKAGRIIRELFLETLECVRKHLGFAVVVGHSYAY